MRLITTALLTLLALGARAQDLERGCSCVRSGIWLDIVAVVDDSASMTTPGLSQVMGNLFTIAGQMSISQNIGQNTRLGFVTYNSADTVRANLTDFNSIEDLLPYLNLNASDVQVVNIEAGLQAAERVIQNSHNRPNVKTVVLLYASAYSSGGFADPLPVAEQLKASGIPIITVAFTQSDTTAEAVRISQLSSPGFAFNSSDFDMISEVFEALCQVNCFCPANWVQFTNNYDNPTRKLGECIRYADIDSSWTAAKYACQSVANGGYLYSEFSPEKHEFVQRFVNDTITYNGNGQWHLGLSYDGGNNQYYWEQPNGGRVALSNSTLLWDGANDFPSTAYGTVVKVQNGKWRNERDFTDTGRYICQLNACDSNSYCAS